MVSSYLASLNTCHFFQINFFRERLEPRATTQTAKRLRPTRGADLDESLAATAECCAPSSQFQLQRGLRQALKVPAGDFQHSLLLRGTAPTHRNLWCWSSGFGTFPRPSRDFSQAMDNETRNASRHRPANPYEKTDRA